MEDFVIARLKSSPPGVSPRGPAQTWRALQPMSCVHAPGPDRQQTRHLCWVLVPTRRKRRGAGGRSAWAGRSPAATPRKSSVSPPPTTTTRRWWSTVRSAESWNTSAATAGEPDRSTVRAPGPVRRETPHRSHCRVKAWSSPGNARCLPGQSALLDRERWWGDPSPSGPVLGFWCSFSCILAVLHPLSVNVNPLSCWLLISSSCASALFATQLLVPPLISWLISCNVTLGVS